MNPLEFDLKQIYQIHKHIRHVDRIEYHINQCCYILALYKDKFYFRRWAGQDFGPFNLSENVLYEEFVQNVDYLVDQIGYTNNNPGVLMGCKEAGCEKNDD